MADWDVTLDGVDYMLVPGSYRAFQDGMTDSRLGRQRLSDFTTGQGNPRPTRGAGGERGGLLAGLGAIPAPWPLGLAGVGPAAARQSVAGGLTGGAEPHFSVSDSTYQYIVSGTNVFRWSRVVGSAPVNRKTLPSAATGIAKYGSDIFICYDAATDVGKYTDSTNTLTASGLGAGAKAWGITAFGGGLVTISNSARTQIKLWFAAGTSATRVYDVDAVIRNWTQAGDDLAIATDAGLYRLTGSWIPGATTTEDFRLRSWGTLAGFQQETDDFAWFTVFNGRLMAWLGKKVLVFDEQRGWWRHAGLEGSQTFGAAVVNGVLYVALSPPTSTGTYELWAYTGSGWWRIESGDTLYWKYPQADGDGKLTVYQSGSTNLSSYDVSDPYTAANLTSPFEVITPALDAGEPDRQKRWRRVGVETLRNDGQPVGDWSVAVSYSIDAGQTWMSAGTAESVTDEVETVDYAIGATGTTLQIKVSVTRSSGLPPVIVAVWAEYELLNESVRRRRWQFRVHARARGVNRAGALDARSGQQIRAALWALWDGAATVTFRDVDYGATGVERSVRLIGIREEWPKPADQSDLGADSTIELTLVDV